MLVLLQFLIAQWTEFVMKTCKFIYTNWQWYKNLIHAISINEKEQLKLLSKTYLMTPFFFNDQAHFRMWGCVSKKNILYWRETNTRELHDQPLFVERVTVWYALSRIGIFGKKEFEEWQSRLSVMSRRLRIFFPKLDETDVINVWFQQDVTTAHTAGTSMSL